MQKHFFKNALVAKLADAHDLGSCEVKLLEVRVLSRALVKTRVHSITRGIQAVELCVLYGESSRGHFVFRLFITFIV